MHTSASVVVLAQGQLSHPRHPLWAHPPHMMRTMMMMAWCLPILATAVAAAARGVGSLLSTNGSCTPDAQSLEGHGHVVTAVAADFEKELALSGSRDGTVKLWSLRNGSLLRTLEGHDSSVYAVAADFEKELALSGSADQTLKLWSLRNGSLLRTLEGHDSSVYAVAADFEKELALSGSADQTLKLWSLRNGSLLWTLEGHDSWVYAVAADFEKEMALSGSADQTLKLWSLRNGSLLRTLEGHDGWVYAVAADFEKELALSGSSDNTLKLWGAYRLCLARHGRKCPEGFRVRSQGQGCRPGRILRQDRPLGCSWKAGSNPMDGDELVLTKGRCPIL